MTDTSAFQPPYKQLRRPTTDRMVAGVASGVGRYVAVDPNLVRVVFAVATLLTGGLAGLAYPIMWFLMPEEPAGAPAWPHPARGVPYTPAPQPHVPQPHAPAPQPGGAWTHRPPTAPTATPEPTPRPQPQPPAR
ncbi:phage shock protein C (PspC) family protein [Micromonospora nigra]|uniref:Phage shock protein C (PspC) family protein n=1 Tax=Micromonospora nigra TaxID=145857 RepID=A0A1C6RQZ0_9ACTN|nr:PspC domain-containing protein [Micromonospora nigra]SCL19543.1 phage shock protein C (PspC) family protein [Micromonospora nigra]